MKLKYSYPTTIDDVADHVDEVIKLFVKIQPHKETFIGLSLLEGSFLIESPGDVYSSLKIGEKLDIIPDKASKNLPLPPLEIHRKNGDLIGNLPYSAAIMPNVLISRGIKVWCYAEAKKFNGGMPEFAVSIYCEKY